MTTSSTIGANEFRDFLVKHRASDSVSELGSGMAAAKISPTHTRIPLDKKSSAGGGKYIIPREDLEEFYRLYYDHVFVKKQKDRLTEKQMAAGGPMAVDFDFHYAASVTARQHTPSQIESLVGAYLNLIKEYYVLKYDTPFEVYIFEKPAVNRASAELTKDGVHMVIGLQIDKPMQRIFRNKLLETGQLADIVLTGLPLINTWESVLDKGVTDGTVNWQLYGSAKPECDAYALTRRWVVTVDRADGEFVMDEIAVAQFDVRQNFARMSVQYDRHPQFDVRADKQGEYSAALGKPIRSMSNIRVNSLASVVAAAAVPDVTAEVITIGDIVDRATLERAVADMLGRLGPKDYAIHEVHQFTQALPPRYYEPGSHALNRQVAFALKRLDDRLFLSWVMLRSRAADFDFAAIPELLNQWRQFAASNSEGRAVTHRSIIYWVKTENFQEYERIKHQSIDYYMERAIGSSTVYDIALVLKQIYADRYVCVSFDGKSAWYCFRDHRWVQDTGLSLRSKISQELFALFERKSFDVMTEMGEDASNEGLKDRQKKICTLKMLLKQTTSKNNILREAAELFYDGDFEKKRDLNPYLLCFNNGVVDFRTKEFRDGQPEDCITLCTDIDYYTDITAHSETRGEIEHMMRTIYPIPDLYEYMWDHLSSCLIGTNLNQVFHIYYGSGSNGKTMITELMTVVLGSHYAGVVPITMVTEGRNKIGSHSDEISKLKYVRYAVMEEPEKGDKLKEGAMKGVTGDGRIQARGIYKESEMFKPQFNLVATANEMFEVRSNDDGTWRRIRKVDHVSKFLYEGETCTDETRHRFLRDDSLKDRFPRYAPVFAHMLVQRAFETGGIIRMCDTVRQASSKYRHSQDRIAAFIEDRMTRTDDRKDRVKKSELMSEFNKWFSETQGASRTTIKADEIYAIMDKRFGAGTKVAWLGVKINYPTEEEASLLGEI